MYLTPKAETFCVNFVLFCVTKCDYGYLGLLLNIFGEISQNDLGLFSIITTRLIGYQLC